MKRSVWIVAGIAALVSIIVAVSEFRSAERSRAVVRDLTQHNRTLDAEFEQVRRELAANLHQEAELSASLQRAKDQKEQPSGVGAASTPPPRREFADLIQLYPGLRDLFKQQYRTDLPFQWRLLYKRARLSPEQIERFEALMVDASLDRMDLQAAATAQGLANNDPGVAKMRRQLAEQVQAAQKEILGDAGYDEMQRVERRRPLAPFMTTLGRLLSPSGDSLTPEQGDRMTDILSNASSEYQRGGRANPRSIDTAVVLQQAEQFLTPVQMAALRTSIKGVEVQKLAYQFYQQKKAPGK